MLTSRSGPADTIRNIGGADKPWTVEATVAELDHIPITDSTSPIPFFHVLERLKTSKREGWRRFGIEQYVYLLQGYTPLCKTRR